MTPPSDSARIGADFPVCLPSPPGSVYKPIWTGNGFQVGHALHKVLAYDVGESGWTDGLTSFHEDIAGDSHYIDRASRAHAMDALLRFLPTQAAVVMDIGCSSGYMLEALQGKLTGATVIGADYVRGPLEQLAQRMPTMPLLQFDLAKCPLPSACLDAVVLLNVLEHIEDDLAAIRQVARILKPNGIAVIEVPAGPNLYDIYDKRLLHFRRYRMNDLVARLESQSLRVLDRSHLGFFLYPAFWVAKKRGQRFLGRDAKTQQKIVAKRIQAGKSNALLHWVMNVEAALRRRLYYPFGIRCLITCSKTES